MPTNYTSLTNGQFATAAVFNAPLTELDNAIQAMVNGTKALTTPDINGGTIDGATIAGGTINNTVIGGTTPVAGTFTGLTVMATSPTLAISGTVGNNRALRLQTGGLTRWAIIANTTAESGSDAGSDMTFNTFDDAGVFKAIAVTITRSNGNINFAGTVSKGGGSFNIDHPLDPLNRNLIHSFVEGPRADLIYRGQTQLVNGQAVANLDSASGMTSGTFEALTRHAAAQVFLQNITGFGAVRATLVGSQLTIQAQNNGMTDTIAWLVIAERNDAFYRASDLTDAQGRFVVEVDKATPTPQELQTLAQAPMGEVVPALVGKKGYPQHAHLTGLARPMRKGVAK